MSESQKQRTLTQNNSLYKYFSLLSKSLNDAGLDMKKTLKPSTCIPWTPESIKTHLWKPVQKIMTEKESTAELSTVEISDIYRTLDTHLAEKFGVSVAWPDRFNQYET